MELVAETSPEPQHRSVLFSRASASFGFRQNDAPPSSALAHHSVSDLSTSVNNARQHSGEFALSKMANQSKADVGDTTSAGGDATESGFGSDLEAVTGEMRQSDPLERQLAVAESGVVYSIPHIAVLDEQNNPCALCQFYQWSRFGQGAMMSYRVRDRSRTAVLEFPNRMKERQQYDDIRAVGHDMIKPLPNILSTVGTMTIHQNCLAWSTVFENDASGLCLNAEEVVSEALLQVCSFCSRFGASVRCAHAHCNAVYHYPCLASSGSFARLQSHSVHCLEHLGDIMSSPIPVDPSDCCFVCSELDLDGSSGRGINDLLFCTTCGRHAHSGCVELPDSFQLIRKTGWQCSDCERCTICQNSESNDRVVSCCDCGRDFHLRCLVPPLAAVPKLAWKCLYCRLCAHCGKRTPGAGPSSKWHQCYSLCDSCYQQKIKGCVCVACQKAYRVVEQRDMLKCNRCSSFTHRSCRNEDPALESFICCRCVDGGSAGPGINLENFPSSTIMSSSVASPSSSSVLSSSLDESSISEQNLGGGGKPLVRLKRRQPTPAATKPVVARKRLRTAVASSSTLASPSLPPGRKRGKGKSLPTLISSVQLTVNGAPGSVDSTGSQDDDDSVHTSTVVIFNTSDELLQAQDICVSCGSIGVGDEGKLIGCAQCGQCYHPYCAGVKLNSVILDKGWRCLDCSACEGCGKPHDEGRLILCDECDISFHIYCLSPPLDQVPTGTWKCKWCVSCQYCGSTSPGHGNCSWQNNYSTCAPCASLMRCSCCDKEYVEQEVIIQCLQCDRWLHAECDNIMEGDDLDAACHIGYVCPSCRPDDQPPLHLQHVFDDDHQGLDSKVVPKASDVKIVIPHRHDGMILSDAGMKHVKQLNSDQSRAKISKKKVFKQESMDSGENSADGINSIAPDSDRSLHGMSEEQKKGIRTRRPQRFGIGGFLMRGPKPRAGKERDPESSGLDTSFEGTAPPSGTLSPTGSTDALGELSLPEPKPKPKKKKYPSKKKPTVRDTFPDYLQDAFFGSDLLNAQEDGESSSGVEPLSMHVNLELPVESKTKSKNATTSRPNVDDKRHVKRETADTGRVSKNESLMRVVDEDFPDLPEGDGDFPADDALDFLPQDLPDNEFMDIMMSLGEQEELAHEPEPLVPGTSARPPHATEQDLMSDNNLSSILDALETDLPQMSSEDAEDVFNDVFMNEDSTGLAVTSTRILHTASGNVTSTSRLVSVSSTVLDQSGSPWGSKIGRPSGDGSESNENVANLKAMARALEDEALGPNATLTNVLFANSKHPDLKLQFPNWTERWKQIQKLWRKVGTEERQPFILKAKENKQAARPLKAQKAKEEKAEKTAVVKLQEKNSPVGAFPMQNFNGPSRFSHQESMESQYSNYAGSTGDEHFSGTPTSVLPPQSPAPPSTPGSASGHMSQPHYHVASPPPPFSPSHDRPRSVLPGQHHGADQHSPYAAQSPHSVTHQVQSPRTPYPPTTSPFDPYGSAPASVPPALMRQQSMSEFSLSDDQDPYTQQPGTPMPQRAYQQQYSVPVNPQSPQNGQFYGRQQLKDLLVRQNMRQRQPGPPLGWHQNAVQSPTTSFPPPQQMEHQPQQQSYPRPPQPFPNRQEFRQPPPPPPSQPRMMQGALPPPRNFPNQNQQQMRFAGVPRAPHQIMQRTMAPAQFADPQQQHMYDQSQARQQQEWQQQQQHHPYPQPGYGENSNFGPMDQQSHQPEYSEMQQHQFQQQQFRMNVPRTPLSPPYNPQSPLMHHSPTSMRHPVPWQGQRPYLSPPNAIPQQRMMPPLAGPSGLNGMMTALGDDVGDADRPVINNGPDFLRNYYYKYTQEQTMLETQIASVRKHRKALAARQRQLKKNGNDLSLEDNSQLEAMTQQVAQISKQLEKTKKNLKEHTVQIQNWQNEHNTVLVEGIPLNSVLGRPAGPSATVPTMPQQQQQPQIRSPGPPGQPFQTGPSSTMSPNRYQQPPVFAEQPFADPQSVVSPRLAAPQRFAMPPHQHPVFQQQQQGPNMARPTLPMLNQDPRFRPAVPYMNNQNQHSGPQNGGYAADPRLPAVSTNIPGGSAAKPCLPNAETKQPRTSNSPGGSATSENGDDRQSGKQYILLKQLLEANPGEQKSGESASPQKPGEEDDDAAASTLTPAQQQQLAMIESMPLTLHRKESSSSSPVPPLMTPIEMFSQIPLTSSAVDDETGGFKKKTTKKKRKKSGIDSDVDMSDQPSEAVITQLVNLLRVLPATLFEPDKGSLPPKSIFVKNDSDALPVPIGKKIEDMRKPPKRNLTRHFGTYVLTGRGPKSSFIVGVAHVNDATAAMDTSSAMRIIYGDCVRNGRTKSDTVKSDMPDFLMKSADDDDVQPGSPALSFASTSSYGESRLLHSCYDSMYAWIDASYPNDEPLAEIVIDEPTLPYVTNGSLSPLYDRAKENVKEGSPEIMMKHELMGPIKREKVFRDSDRVNVTMTISEEAARDLRTLLQMPIGDILMFGSGDDEIMMTIEEKPQKFCRWCEVAVADDKVIRKRLSDFPFVSLLDNGFPVEEEEGTPYLFFCSERCLAQFAMTNQGIAKTSPPPSVSVDHKPLLNGKVEPKREKKDSVSGKRNSVVQNILKSIAPLLKKGKKTRHELWSPALLQVKEFTGPTEIMTPEQVLSKLDVGIKVSPEYRDKRSCVLCHLVGDFLTDGPGRLLNLDGDMWVHLNCALWSTEVYETKSGHLMKFENALERSTKLHCSRCQKRGATMGCYKQPKVRCGQTFHFPCALASNSMFFTDKTILCDMHKPREPPPDQLINLSVHRRVCVNRDEFRLAAKVVQNPTSKLLFPSRNAHLSFHWSPDNDKCRYVPQRRLFVSVKTRLQLGFSVTRIFWSMHALNRRCYYHCTIRERGGFPEFQITVKEAGYEEVVLRESTTKGVWMIVLTAVLALRSKAMIKVFPDFFTGDDLFGLAEQNISRLIESLPGVDMFANYRRKFELSKLVALSAASESGRVELRPSSQLQRRKLSADKTVGQFSSMDPAIHSFIPKVPSPLL